MSEQFEVIRTVRNLAAVVGFGGAALGIGIPAASAEMPSGDPGPGVGCVNNVGSAPGTAPSAGSGSVEVARDSSCDYDLSGSISPSNGKITTVSSSFEGVLSFKNGKLHVTPWIGHTATGELKYTVTAGGKTSAVAKVAINVTGSAQTYADSATTSGSTSSVGFGDKGGSEYVSFTNTNDDKNESAVYTVTAQGCGITASASSNEVGDYDDSSYNSTKRVLNQTGSARLTGLASGAYSYSWTGSNGTSGNGNFVMTDHEGNVDANCATSVVNYGAAAAPGNSQAPAAPGSVAKPEPGNNRQENNGSSSNSSSTAVSTGGKSRAPALPSDKASSSPSAEATGGPGDAHYYSNPRDWSGIPRTAAPSPQPAEYFDAAKLNKRAPIGKYIAEGVGGFVGLLTLKKIVSLTRAKRAANSAA